MARETRKDGSSRPGVAYQKDTKGSSRRLEARELYKKAFMLKSFWLKRM